MPILEGLTVKGLFSAIWKHVVADQINDRLYSYLASRKNKEKEGGEKDEEGIFDFLLLPKEEALAQEEPWAQKDTEGCIKDFVKNFFLNVRHIFFVVCDHIRKPRKNKGGV